MIQLTSKGVVFCGTTADLRCAPRPILTRPLLHPAQVDRTDLLAMILKRIEAAPFKHLEYNRIVAQSVDRRPD